MSSEVHIRKNSIHNCLNIFFHDLNSRFNHEYLVTNSNRTNCKIPIASFNLLCDSCDSFIHDGPKTRCEEASHDARLTILTRKSLSKLNHFPKNRYSRFYFPISQSPTSPWLSVRETLSRNCIRTRN